MCYHRDSERVRKAHMYDIDVDILNICTMEYKLQIKEND